MQQLSKLPSAHPVDDIQILSWNNYERGSQIEAGVDNCVSITPTVAADTLTWQVTGNVGTVDHYAVYASTDGTTLTLVAKTLPDTNSLVLDTLNLAADTQYVIYVQAVGKPSVLNKLSSPASYSPAARHAPVIQLTVSPISGVAPLAVHSSITISGTYTSSSIDFGDGTVVKAVSALHSYATPGRYSVKATVTNRGLSSSATATVTVTAPANQLPTAKLSVTPTSGTVPVTVNASTAGSIDPDGSIASTRIDFGDGTIVSSVSGSHIYVTAGTYTVKATVTDNGGLSSSATATVTVTAPANQSPVAKLSVTPTSGTVPVTVNSSTAGSIDPDGSIASTKIDFGDGTIVSATSGSHIYVTAGTYTVRATVTDNGGLSSSATATVTVTATANQPPTAKLSVTPTSGTVPVTVNASTAGSSDPGGSIASTKIDFGDGTIVSAASGSHLYVTAGTYTVKATVTDNGGLSSSATATVTSSVSAPPPGSQITHGITIPTTHPRLWFDSSRLASAKTWYASHPITSISGDTNFSYMQEALKGLLASDTPSCRSAINWALGLNIAGQSTGISADWMRWYGEQINMTWDWCYPQMTPTERSTIISKVNTWYDLMISVANSSSSATGSPTQVQNNYFHGYMRNEIEWAIVSYEENIPKAETYLNDALLTRWTNSFLPVASTTSKGGVGQEGLEYGSYPPWYAIVPFETSNLMGRNLFDASNYFKENVFQIIYSTTPAVTTTVNGTISNGTVAFEMFPFSDDQNFANGTVVGGVREWGDVMTRAANRWNGINVGKYAQAWLNTVAPPVSEHIASVSTAATPLALSNLALDYFAPGNSYLYGRKMWDSSSTIFNIQLGMPTYGTVVHVHDDVGNWQLWRGGRWVSRESAGYSNTFVGYNNAGTISSGDVTAHNGILFNGLGLGTVCPAGACFNGVRNGPPVVNRLESQTGYTYADVDLTNSYRNNVADQWDPQRENPAVAHVEREYVFVRALETLVIFDRLQSNAVGATAAANIKKTFLAHCEVNWKVEDAQHATCTDGDQALRLTTLVPSTPTYVVVNERGDNVGQYRLEVNDSGSAQSYFLTVLQSKSSVAVNLAPSVVDNGGSYTITLDGTHSITFNKGMSSAGGSVTLSGTTTLLRGNVQGMSVTDSGPVWASVQ